MKNSIYIALLATSFMAKAQDSQLFEHTWILHDLLLDDAQIELPSVIAELEFSENDITVIHNFCEEAYVGNLEYSGETSFAISEGLIALVGTCSQPELLEFMANHYSFYGEVPSFLTHNNPFNYEITTSGDELTLIINNGNGDVATYGNFALSLQENALSLIQLLYHPENKNISFIGLEQEVFLALHNLSGQKQLEASINNSQTIDLSSLSKGVYFAVVVNHENQRVTRKFVKY